MFYKYALLFSKQKYLYSQSILIALLGLLLWSDKSSASEYSADTDRNKVYIHECLEAKCLTLDSDYKPSSQNQLDLTQSPTLKVDRKEFYNPNIWLGRGIDPLDPLPSKKNFSLYFSKQALPSMTISSVIEHGSKKENPQAMLNQVNVWRAGSSLYWKLFPNTILSSSALWGNYNDGNNDFQTYSRLDRNFGSFSLSADLSTASYKRDLEISRGYFSPSNYLLYSAEAAWKQRLFDSSTCKLALRAGQQKLSGDLAKVYSFGSFCEMEISTAMKMNFNYSLANVNGTESEIYHGFTGTVKFAL